MRESRWRRVTKTLKAWGLMWFTFACVSAMYLNHYSHPKSFYAWSIVDAALMFALLAVANAVLYPRIVGLPLQRGFTDRSRR